MNVIVNEYSRIFVGKKFEFFNTHARNLIQGVMFIQAERQQWDHLVQAAQLDVELIDMHNYWQT